MAVNSFSGLPAIPASYGFTAGKNKIINGDFNVNQRGFSSTTSDATYMFDRWLSEVSSGATYSSQTFTPGTAPVSGYEGKNFLRILTSGQSGTGVYTTLRHKVEGVRTFAGQTTTLSFWAKAASGTPKIAIDTQQNFGTGGSPSATVVTYYSQVTLSTSWQRYSVTLAVPSISGKTIGTNNNDSLNLTLWVSAGTDFNASTGSLGVQNNTFDIWGVQWEAGSTATAFQTATGTLAGELAACQRYYVRFGGANSYEMIGQGNAYSSTNANILVTLPVTLRVGATSIDYSTLALQKQGADPVYAITGLTLEQTGKNVAAVTAVIGSSNLTGAINYRMFTNNSTSGYLGFSAEL